MKNSNNINLSKTNKTKNEKLSLNLGDSTINKSIKIIFFFLFYITASVRGTI